MLLDVCKESGTTISEKKKSISYLIAGFVIFVCVIEECEKVYSKTVAVL